MSTLDIDAADFLAGFDRELAELRTRTAAAVEDTVAAVHDDAFVFAPVDTGYLREHIYHETRVFPASVRGEAGVRDVRYAAVAEFGSAPHVIRPVHAKVLRWVDAEGEHFARVVHHPGTRPTAFLRSAWARAPQHWRRAVARHLGLGRG